MAPQGWFGRVVCVCRYVVVVAVLGLSGVGSVNAADSTSSVYWAGFAFTGEASSKEELAPHVSAVLERRGIEPLNQLLYGEFAKQPPKNLALVADRLASLDGTTSAVVLAAALDRELVSIERIGGQYKVLVELALQGLFFDFRERQVIAAYPLTLQRIDLMSERPDTGRIQSIVEGLLYGPSATDLPTAFAGLLANARLAGAAAKRIQVAEVEIDATVLQKLGDASRASTLGASLAHELTKALSSSTGLGLLPPASGQAIGGAMAARFSDGKVYQLKIPEADYLVRAKVDGMKSGVVDESPAMRQMLFGAFFTVSVVEPYSGKTFFQQPLRKGAFKVVPVTQVDVDQRSAGYETLLAGFDSFAGIAAARAGHAAWLSEQKPGGRSLQQETKALQELIASCR